MNSIPDVKKYELLAAAIIQQACEDYVFAWRGINNNRWKPDSTWQYQYKKEIKENESFFHSQWFETLTERNIDPDILVERLRYIAEKTEIVSFGNPSKF